MNTTETQSAATTARIQALGALQQKYPQLLGATHDEALNSKHGLEYRADYQTIYRTVYNEQNKERIAASKKAHRLANLDKYRNQDYMRHYGISLDTYNQMLRDQDGKCAICNKHESALTSRLHCDHDHATGRVRSLLCDNCNAALGKFNDSPALLRKAADYLDMHSTAFNPANN